MAGGDFTRRANKSEMPYSTTVRKIENDLESVSATASPPTVNRFSRLVGSILGLISTKSSTKSADYFCSNPNPAHTQTSKQT